MNRYNELNVDTRKSIDMIINALASAPSIQKDFKPIADDLHTRLIMMTRLSMYVEKDTAECDKCQTKQYLPATITGDLKTYNLCEDCMIEYDNCDKTIDTFVKPAFITCECGKTLANKYHNIYIHKRSKWHKKFIESQ